MSVTRTQPDGKNCPALWSAIPSSLYLKLAKAAFIFHMDPNLARADQENAAIFAAGSAQTVLNELANHVRAHAGPISASDFSGWMNEIKDASGVQDSELFDPIRIALTGTHSGPDFDKLIPLIEQGVELNLGIPSVRQRLDAFVGV